MAHISGDDRSQLLLLPETVDDYVRPDNVVRFIEALEAVAVALNGRPRKTLGWRTPAEALDTLSVLLSGKIGAIHPRRPNIVRGISARISVLISLSFVS
jgi:hypothetical protein